MSVCDAMQVHIYMIMGYISARKCLYKKKETKILFTICNLDFSCFNS